MNGFPVNLIQRLQSVQNAAARLIFRIRRSEHITPTLISLHDCASQSASLSNWLTWRTDRSTALHIVTYSRTCFTRVADMSSRRRLRSSASHRLELPPVRLYSWQTGVPSCRRQHVERPFIPHHICSHSRSSDSVSRLSSTSSLVPTRTYWYDLLIISCQQLHCCGCGSSVTTLGFTLLQNSYNFCCRHTNQLISSKPLTKFRSNFSYGIYAKNYLYVGISGAVLGAI